jgi:hypothetical protein
MTAVSQGGRVNPTMEGSRMKVSPLSVRLEFASDNADHVNAS